MNKLLLTLVGLMTLSVAALAADAASTQTTLRHVVAFKFKDTATKKQIKEVETAFMDLRKTVTEIQTLEWGTNVSPEKLDKGFTHCFVLTFNTVKDRDAYLVHPDHKAFGQRVGPVLDDVFVIDFWAKN